MKRRLRAAIVVVAVWMGIQAVLVGTRGLRDPSPYRTFHDFDVTLAQTVKIMRGEAWAPALPVAELVPNTQPGYGPPQMWARVPANSSGARRMYKREQPLFFLLAGLVPAVVGLGPVSLRLGPLAVLWALAGLLGWSAHRLAGVRGLLAAAGMMLLVPAGWQTSMMSLPGLGMMLGAGLVCATVLASDRLRHPLGAAAAGASVGVASWMGESAGDTVQVLAAVVPTLIAGGIWGLLAPGTGRQRVSALLGTGIALGVARLLVDVPWILRHTGGYLLSEASGGGRPPDLYSFLQTVPSVLGRNLVDGYAETLAHSLLAPAGALFVLIGVVAGLVSRYRAGVVWALCGPMGLLIVLSMPEKTGDYYALSATPGILLAGALGFSALGRVGTTLLTVLGSSLAVVMFTVIHMDLPVTHPIICAPVGAASLLQDPTACATKDPHPRIRPTMRIARHIPGAIEGRRLRVNEWLGGRQMKEIWPEIPQGSAVWILGASQSPIDVAQVGVMTRRPDTLVGRLPNQSRAWQLRTDLGGPEEWIVLLGTSNVGRSMSARWPMWVGEVEDFGGTGAIRVGRVKNH